MDQTENPPTFEEVFGMLTLGEERLTWKTRKIWPAVKELYADHALLNSTYFLKQQRDELCHELYGMVLPETIAPVKLTERHQKAIVMKVQVKGATPLLNPVVGIAQYSLYVACLL